MLDAVKHADKFIKRLKKMYGGRMLADVEVDAALAEALAEAKAEGAGYAAKHVVRFKGEVEGKRVVSAAEVVFARFGQGDQAAWIVLAVFDGNWCGVYRPLTKDTATMPWLDAFVTNELAGFQ